VAVAVTAATFTGNHGAEAMLLATLEGLRRRLDHPAFHVFTYRPTADARVARDPDVTLHSLTPAVVVFVQVPLAAAYALLRHWAPQALLRRFPRRVRSLAGCAVQVDLAGVSFVDGRARFLPYNVLTLVPAFLVGVPVVKLAQALGPFRAPLNRWVARPVLGRCAAVFARGDETLRHLGALDCGAEVRRADDVAFLLEAEAAGTPVVARAVAQVARRRGGARAVVGVCPSSLLAGRRGSDYLARTTELVADLVGQGDIVVLFPHATRGVDARGARNNDLYALRRILAGLDPASREGVIPVDGDVRACELLSLTEILDMAVVSRLHAMVACLSRGVPVAVVGWSHKYREVMRAFGMEEHVLDATGNWPSRAAASLDRFRSAPEEWRGRLADALPGVRASAASQLDWVADRVRSWGR
jgi:polysaccharide pyruvyl transferase WcaK-like protein